MCKCMLSDSAKDCATLRQGRAGQGRAGQRQGRAGQGRGRAYLGVQGQGGQGLGFAGRGQQHQAVCIDSEASCRGRGAGDHPGGLPHCLHQPIIPPPCIALRHPTITDKHFCAS